MTMRVFQAVAPSPQGEYPSVHALNPQLHGGDGKRSDQIEFFFGHRIGAGGKPDAVNLSALDKIRGQAQKITNDIVCESEERSPVKGNLDGMPVGGGVLEIGLDMGFQVFLRGHSVTLACDRRLVAEHAAVGAAFMGNEHRDDERFSGFILLFSWQEDL